MLGRVYRLRSGEEGREGKRKVLLESRKRRLEEEEGKGETSIAK